MSKRAEKNVNSIVLFIILSFIFPVSALKRVLTVEVFQLVQKNYPSKQDVRLKGRLS